MRHLGAEVTLLTVLTEEENQSPTRSRIERFLADGMRTLKLLGVPAQTIIRLGAVRQEISNEIVLGSYDLLVMGAPLSKEDGRIVLTGIVGQILNTVKHPILIVRSSAT